MADPHEDFQNGDLTIVATKKNENESESSSLDKRRPSNKSNKSVSFQEDPQNGQTDPDDNEAAVVRSGHFSQKRMSRMSMRSFR